VPEPHFYSLHAPGATGTPGPAYWGYTVSANLLPLMASTLHASKMIAVFDIDETLLMAHTVDSLSARLNRITAERWVVQRAAVQQQVVFGIYTECAHRGCGIQHAIMAAKLGLARLAGLCNHHLYTLQCLEGFGLVVVPAAGALS
jgi:hypothetical protein